MSGRDDWIDGGTGDWLGADSDDAPPTPANPRRRWALIVVCERCDSADAHRHNVSGGKAYWRCRGCGHTWSEEPGVGQGRATLA